jgi:hypothetical protein
MQEGTFLWSKILVFLASFVRGLDKRFGKWTVAANPKIAKVAPSSVALCGSSVS